MAASHPGVRDPVAAPKGDTYRGTFLQGPLELETSFERVELGAAMQWLDANVDGRFADAKASVSERIAAIELQLAQLNEDGILSDAEFKKKKAELLKRL